MKRLLLAGLSVSLLVNQYPPEGSNRLHSAVWTLNTKVKGKKTRRKRAGEEAAATGLGGRDTGKAVWSETGDCGSVSECFRKFFVRPSTVPRTYGFGNIFHHNCPHLQHGINILRFADIWAQFDRLRAAVVQLRVWDKEAVSGPGGGIQIIYNIYYGQGK